MIPKKAKLIKETWYSLPIPCIQDDLLPPFMAPTILQADILDRDVNFN